MIATIQAKDKPSLIKATMEAWKCGIEYEVFEDNYLDITVHTQDTANRIANYAAGKIVAVNDYKLVGPYSGVEELI